MPSLLVIADTSVDVPESARKQIDGVRVCLFARRTREIEIDSCRRGVDLTQITKVPDQKESPQVVRLQFECLECFATLRRGLRLAVFLGARAQ